MLPAGADEFRDFPTSLNMHAYLARMPEGSLRKRFVLGQIHGIGRPRQAAIFARLLLTGMGKMYAAAPVR